MRGIGIAGRDVGAKLHPLADGGKLRERAEEKCALGVLVPSLDRIA